jgi:hypothetical protein
VNKLYHQFKHYKKHINSLSSKLFVCRDKYNDLIEYYNSISAFYTDDKQSGYECCKQIITNQIIYDRFLSTTISNIMFYKEPMINDPDKTMYNRFIKKDDEMIMTKQYTNDDTTNDFDINTPYIVVAILAKDKENVLDFYLQCIYNQTYDKKHIHLYIRTNDNNDQTAEKLKEFVKKAQTDYASIYYNDTNINEAIKQYKNHEWNTERFSIIGKIRQDSVEYAKKLSAHYFVADCDNFIIPTTLSDLYLNKHLGVVSPLLNHSPYTSNTNVYQHSNYSNFHYDVTDHGYYKDNELYFKIVHRGATGIFNVKCVHCSYFIANKYLSNIYYSDNSVRHEYVIFSESLRKKNINQYIDNTKQYGYLTFAETKEDFDLDYNYWKNIISFETSSNLNIINI